jgi:thiol-disulfide isomerase/thioredoxin
LLIKGVVARYGGRVRYVDENYGASKLAARFGVKRYPVVFVDDVLVVQPKDFGGWGDKGGKYAPWREPANQTRFQEDVARAIDRALSGEAGESVAVADDEIKALPELKLTDTAGHAFANADLAGRVVVVEFWATGCAPCRSPHSGLATLERRDPGQVTVIAVALDSPDAEVAKVAKTLDPRAHVVVGTADLASKFGDFSGVPTMFVFDGAGKTASVFYGAAPDVHERAERAIGALVANDARPR